ncbi:hypothetical protein FHR32_001887 [Streptosporangium album]|uniref:Uncharacterized protein n=1 Tax=Streptosporangium album TaxID=47479 RepID=A0A7W7RTF3_9ACTN|nr:hypothetical protein [Streptosporangium album]
MYPRSAPDPRHLVTMDSHPVPAPRLPGEE